MVDVAATDEDTAFAARWTTATAVRAVRISPGGPGVRLRCSFDLCQELPAVGTAGPQGRSRPDRVHRRKPRLSSPSGGMCWMSMSVRTRAGEDVVGGSCFLRGARGVQGALGSRWAVAALLHTLRPLPSVKERTDRIWDMPDLRQTACAGGASRFGRRQREDGHRESPAQQRWRGYRSTVGPDCPARHLHLVHVTGPGRRPRRRGVDRHPGRHG
ncbi:DUF6207 family protein [Streptomyces sp. MAR25Y5]|nr:DUF6207 family protein [Streptomyces sp. MAR25Y5]MCP3770704.1 DUF6207 family protein [Streptomyces sp. MAR25Y5]